jgi:hypothetical protein
MRKEYCISCGAANLFEVNRPKFCCGCGNVFNDASPQTSQAKKRNVGRTKYEEDDEDEYDEYGDYDNSSEQSSFDLNKLKQSISIDLSAQKTSVEDLFANPLDPAHKESFSRDYKGPKGKALLKDIAKQCGTSRGEFKE